MPILQQVKHESSPEVMLDVFEKETMDELSEVSRQLKFRIMFYFPLHNWHISKQCSPFAEEGALLRKRYW